MLYDCNYDILENKKLQGQTIDPWLPAVSCGGRGLITKGHKGTFVVGLFSISIMVLITWPYAFVKTDRMSSQRSFFSLYVNYTSTNLASPSKKAFHSSGKIRLQVVVLFSPFPKISNTTLKKKVYDYICYCCH